MNNRNLLSQLGHYIEPKTLVTVDLPKKEKIKVDDLEDEGLTKKEKEKNEKERKRKEDIFIIKKKVSAKMNKFREE